MIAVRRIEDMGVLLKEFQLLHLAHWLESGGDEQEFNFRYDLLKRMWEQNMVRSWGLFYEDKLVGHATVYVLFNMNTGKPCAEDQAVYVMPAYRIGYGSLIWSHVMKDLAKEGITEIGITCAVGNSAAEIAKRSFGFKHVANRYTKSLSETQHV